MTDAKSEIARISAVVEHQSQSIEQIEFAGRETASTVGEHRARLRHAEDVLKRHESLIAGGKDSLTVRMGVIEEMAQRILDEVKELREAIADLDRRKVSGDLQRTNDQPSDLAKVKLAEEETKKTLIKLLLAGGAGGGIGALFAKAVALLKAWIAGPGGNH